MSDYEQESVADEPRDERDDDDADEPQPWAKTSSGDADDVTQD